jgi:hypothetical protein
MYIVTDKFIFAIEKNLKFCGNLFLRLKKMRNFAEFIVAIGRIWEHLRH